MRRIWICAIGVVAVGLFSSISASANNVNVADFPLRVHIVGRNGFRHYHGYGGGMTSLQEVDGMGQGNLFENGQPLGFDFTYECDLPLTHQSTYVTFMARWKKPGRELEVVLPAIGGKPGQMNSCEMKVTMKQDTVYSANKAGLHEESAARYKQWMIDHQYDPEHGKNEPVGLDTPVGQ